MRGPPAPYRGGAGSGPRQLTLAGSKVFFSANDGIHGRELWVSDGTTAGTRLVRDLKPGRAGWTGFAIARLGTRACFSPADEDLWCTSGTPASTRLVHRFKGIDLAGSAAMGPLRYFGADGALWRTDGTSNGTRPISATWLDASGLSVCRKHLSFAGLLHTGPGGTQPAPRLWRSDGTRAGTGTFGDARAPMDLTALHGRLLFTAFRPGGAVRLWASDGTAATTAMVHGGAGDWFTSDDDQLEAAGIGGRIWFAAGPGSQQAGRLVLSDHEPWLSGGTSAGTREAIDLNASGSSFPRELTRLGSVLRLGADDGIHGRELWRITP